MKNILVELDQQTANLMKEVNADFSGEIRECNENLFRKVKDQLIEIQEEYLENLSVLRQNTQTLKSDTERKLKNLEELLEEIYEALQVEELEKLVSAIPVIHQALQSFSTAEERQKESHDELILQLETKTDSITTGLSEIKRQLESKADTVIASLTSDLKRIEQNGNANQEDMFRKLEAINALIERAFKASSDELSQKSDDITSKLTTSLDTLLARIEAAESQLDKRIGEMDSRMVSLNNSLTSKLDEKTEDLNEKLDVLTARLDLVISKQKESMAKANSHTTILEKILYYCTPFWKRDKNNNITND